MDMIGRNRIVQDLYAKPFTSLIQPIDVPLPGLSKLQQKFLLVASMGDMPYVVWNEVSVSSWQDSPLQRNNLYLSISLFLPLKMGL
jgi:hypothetical protein